MVSDVACGGRPRRADPRAKRKCAPASVDESLLAVTIQAKDDAGWVARVVCVVSGRGFNDDPCAATCTSMVDEGLKGGADRVHADCFQRLSDVGGWVLGDFKRAVPLLTWGRCEGRP